MKRSAFFIVVVLASVAVLACVPKSSPESRPSLPPVADVAVVTADPVPSDAPFTIAGSGSNIALTQRLLDAYAAKIGQSIHIPPSIGTSGAIKSIQAGALNLGLSSRPLKAAEKASGLKEIAYARIGIVIGVHADVPDISLTGAELMAIFNGDKTAWTNGALIVVLARESGDSSNLILEQVIPGFGPILAEALAQKRWDILYTDQDANDALRSRLGSIGLTDTAALPDLGTAVKALSFNGVLPSLDQIKSGAYPLLKDLYFIYRDPIDPDAQAFIDFCRSPEALVVLHTDGACLPPND